MKLQPLFLLMIALVFATGCGPGKKLTKAQNENAELQSRNAALAKDVDSLSQQVDDLNTEFTAYKGTCEETQRAFNEMNDILEKEAETMQRVEEKLLEAMVDFSNKGVEVYTKQGLVHVSISDELLYKSGSASLGKDGKAALATLSAVLNDYPNLKVIIVGNTDSVQYKAGTGDNWTLSTERANGVVRVLRDNKVDPQRLTSAGKAKYNPVADNSTAAGRSKNRRTDIILNPDIERIWNIARNEE